MTRIPKSIKIGALDYEIIQQPTVFHKDGTRCNALIDPDVLKIRMERGLKRQKKQEHILHEATHGIFDGFPFDDDDIEEKVVAYLAPRIIQLLKDNPDLVSFLIS